MRFTIGAIEHLSNLVADFQHDGVVQVQRWRRVAFLEFMGNCPLSVVDGVWLD
jgi:hypothetical protein